MGVTLPGTGETVETRPGAGGDDRQIVGIGAVAKAHGTNPTAAAAGADVDQIANRHGIPFVLGGHPNIISRSHTVSDNDGAQTNTVLVLGTSGNKIVITQISAVCDANNTINIAVRIGFALATLPAGSVSGANGLIIDGNFGPGSGQQKGQGAGIIAIGPDNHTLLLTCGDPQGGNLFIQYSYFTIES